MKCPNCNKEITDNVKFCRYCGTKIETRPEQAKCPKCGALNRQGATFCDTCGAKMSEDETPKDSSVTSSTSSVSEKNINDNDKNYEDSNETEKTDPDENFKKFCLVMIVLFTLVFIFYMIIAGISG